MENIRDFGAVGNGIHDDTEAVQDAVNALGSGRLYIPAGRYRVTRPVGFGEDLNRRVLISGDGPASTILCDHAPFYHCYRTKPIRLMVKDLGFECMGTEAAIIHEGIFFYHNDDPAEPYMLQNVVFSCGSDDSPETSEARALVKLIGVNSCRILDCSFRLHGSHRVGIHLQDSVNVLISRCNFWGEKYQGVASQQGVYAPDGGIDPTPGQDRKHGRNENIRVQDSVLMSLGTAISIIGGNEHWIDSNMIDQNDVGLYMQDTHRGRFTSNDFAPNEETSDASSHCVWFHAENARHWGDAENPGIALRLPLFEGNILSGYHVCDVMIKISGNADRQAVSANGIFVNNNFGYWKTTVFAIDHCRHTRIGSNVFENSVDRGHWFEDLGGNDNLTFETNLSS